MLFRSSSSAWRNRSTGAFSLVEASALYGLDAAAAAAVRAGRRGTPEVMSPSEALQALDPLYAEATWAGAAPAGPIGTTIWLEDGTGASVAILFTGLACFVASAYFVREAVSSGSHYRVSGGLSAHSYESRRAKYKIQHNTLGRPRGRRRRRQSNRQNKSTGGLQMSREGDTLKFKLAFCLARAMCTSQASPRCL